MYVFDQFIGILTNSYSIICFRVSLPLLVGGVGGEASEGWEGLLLPQFLPQVDQHVLCHGVQVVFRLPSPLLSGTGVIEAVGP